MERKALEELAWTGEGRQRLALARGLKSYLHEKCGRILETATAMDHI